MDKPVFFEPVFIGSLLRRRQADRRSPVELSYAGVCQAGLFDSIMAYLFGSRWAGGAQALSQPERNESTGGPLLEGYAKACPRPLHGFTLVELLVVVAIDLPPLNSTASRERISVVVMGKGAQ
jgi:hypothetical protein